MSVKPNHDKSYPVGIVLILISFALYCLPSITNIKGQDSFGLFGINYLFTLGYFIYLLVAKKLKRSSGALDSILLWFVLALISAYSLNRSMPVFQSSVQWLSISLVAGCISYMFLGVFHKLPKLIKIIQLVMLGVMFSILVYLAIYLFKIYPISVFGLIAFGISIHSFVPLLFALFTLKKINRLNKISITYTYSFIIGIVASLIVAVFFTLSWNKLNDTIKKEMQRSLIADNTDLPSWVSIATNVQDNSLAEKYLKCELVYSIPSNTWGWTMPNVDFDEVKKHDPLIMFACIFSKPAAININERVKILESLHDARHKTQDRLWSGDDLVTQAVITNARIWPQSHIAYTEKTITIHSEKNSNSWAFQHEAIYTFYLPEGGVVTSLSLWIDDKEEKGVLTTKSKADSAYKTIVGVESRDPSVVHWQEGNTVSVRVFPILSGANRIFKIGITAPLKSRGEYLAYENIYFKGPDANDAIETIQIDWDEMPNGFTMPDGYVANNATRYIKETLYNPSWELTFKKKDIDNSQFSFDGDIYTAQLYNKEYKNQFFDRIYLDVNRAWTKEELRQVFELTKDKQVYVFADEMLQVDKNTKDIALKLADRNFSLFPFYELKERENSLIITKSKPNTPNIKDIKGSHFAEKLEAKIVDGKYNVFCIDNNLSPYMKTLKEHRVFNYDHGNIKYLEQLISSGRYINNIENDSLIVIENADLILSKSKGMVEGNGPDHLMRLFAYNHLMHKLGTGIFSNQETNKEFISEAEKAYIVSPVSSLVVLESQKDYDRFDINKSKNSLDNASIKSKGAVPEPHEWALSIIALLAIVFYIRYYKLKPNT